jgi:DNA polymerase II large subunit
MREYFEGLDREASRCYEMANRARARGLDPELTVEIPPAEDLPSRVERLLKDYGLEGIAERIRELSAEHDREETSLLLARELATRPARNVEEAIERAVRTGLAILTEGIVVAPLEGLAGVKVKKNADGSSYVDLYYSGPIRSAGGTAQALSVLIADVVRRELGIGAYRATREEVERLKEEIPVYKRLQHLQYTPSEEEIEIVVSHCPVGINGEGTEEEEIGGYRDLPRVETNRIRGGACLVIAEGLCLKAPKILKHVRKLGIDGWDFLEDYVSRWKEGEEESGIDPSYKFIQNILAGRPVLAHPSRKGGFRLRYGRSRATGLAAVGLHPATMYLLDEFIAVGTQIKVERPGKAGAVAPCTSIEGPLVLLRDGSLVEVETLDQARALRPEVETIVDLGEILVAFGEFLENNHPLVPGAFGLDWYRAELERALGELPEGWERLSFREAVDLSREHGVPLHPRFNLFWHDLSVEELKRLRELLAEKGRMVDGRLRVPAEEEMVRMLVDLGCPFHREDDEIVVGRHSEALLVCLGIEPREEGMVLREDVDASNPLEYVSRLSGVRVKARAPTRIGARMGRPEKAKERLMRPPPHGLFPIGREGGSQRLLSKALEKDRIIAEVGIRKCQDCGRAWFLPLCPCGGHTAPLGRAVEQPIPLRELHSQAMETIGEGRIQGVKLVQGMISRNKTPEPLEKALLRAKHGIFVFKDGTTRFDMTNLPLTHFKPAEVGLRVEKARELGYAKDVNGTPLEREDQLLELRPQDIIVSSACGEYMLRVARFVDDLLVKVYGLEPFYNVQSPEDLIGHLVVGLAPHTSVGVLGRIAGLTPARVCFAHPFFHAAKRRDADGDEDSVILLLDGLLNFSREFLPEKRGGLMDAPLVLSTRIDPREIDKEAQNMEVCLSFPLELYEAAERFTHPREVEDLIDTVAKRIGTVLQFEGFGCTQDVESIVEAPLLSAYKEGNMVSKMEGQLALANRIRAVDAEDVVSRIVTHHFLPDLIGNLKAFTSQQFRCTKCNAKYRRIPLKGKCLACGGNLSLTVHPSSVVKYLEVSKRISEEYGISTYLRQRIELVEEAIESTFHDESKQVARLEDFL